MEYFLIIFVLYYIVGWVHAAAHSGFPKEKPLLVSLFFWPLYYWNKP